MRSRTMDQALDQAMHSPRENIGVVQAGWAHRPVQPGRNWTAGLLCTSGQALVEFGICLPILMLVVFGIFTFGVAFSNDLVLEDATNVGARQLAISRGQSTDPCSTVSTAVIAAAPTLTRANLVFNYTLNGVAYSGTTCSGAVSNLVQGTTAKITVTYPCSLVSYRWNFGSACTLSAATAELIQ